jgi:hypothetical protein
LWIAARLCGPQLTNLPYQVTHTDGSTSERNRQNMPFNPFDIPAAHIFEIGADGLAHDIEAVGFVAPYNSPTGGELTPRVRGAARARVLLRRRRNALPFPK